MRGPLGGRLLRIDGFNVLITAEVALGGGVLLRGRDRFLRDLASVHGTYRTARVTEAAARYVVAAAAALGPDRIEVLLDAPVSNSGRVAALFRRAAETAGVRADVRTVPDPDALLAAGGAGAVVATADTRILDAGVPSIDLASATVARVAAGASGSARPWIVDLGIAPDAGP